MVSSITLDMRADAKQKKSGDQVLAHSIAIVPDFSFSPQKFYELIEEALRARKLPGLEIFRVDYAEGGLLSEKRVYLRFLRERLAFDTCAAPFGTEYLFSCRTVYSPVKLRLWHVLVAFAILTAGWYFLVKPLGVVSASIAIFTLVLALAQTLQNVGAMNFGDLDAIVLKIPVVSPIYERFFRKETFYREDTRLAYTEIVPKLFNEVVDEITAKDGPRLVRRYDRAPIFGDLYVPRSTFPMA